MSSEPTQAEEHLRIIEESVTKKGEECRILVEAVKPDKAIEALFLRACGTSYSETKRQTGLCDNTLRALENRHPEALKAIRPVMTRNMTIAAHKATQLLAQKIHDLATNKDLRDKTSIKDISVSAAVAVDKSLLLNGEAAMTVEHVHRTPFEDYQRTIREAKARVIDVPAQQITTDNQP